MPEPVWLKVAQVAQAMQLSESSIYRMVRSGEIPVRWVGGRVRIHRNFIEEDAWVQSERTTTIFPQQPSQKSADGKTTRRNQSQRWRSKPIALPWSSGWPTVSRAIRQ